jgi:signal transduction histidine kinase
MEIESDSNNQPLLVQSEDAIELTERHDTSEAIAKEQVAFYQDFSTRCFWQEMAVVSVLTITFALAYLFCYLAGIEYGTFMHGKILYAVFVFFNIYAAAQAFYSWAVIGNKSVTRDYMFFWAVAFIGAAIGNSLDFALWASDINLFKQNMLTNMIFIFSMILSFPGVHFLAQVCQVRINKLPILYFVPLAVTFAIIPAYMNLEIIKSIFAAKSLVDISRIPNLKEFLFGISYSLVGGYLSAVSLFTWQTGKGRLVHSARLTSYGTIIFSFGCSIYAGLFPSAPLLSIPGNPSHLLIAMGYMLVALGVRRSEKTVKALMNLEADQLPAAVSLVEIFGKNEGLAVYKRLEKNIQHTLLELMKSREETQHKQEEIGQLEQEVRLRKQTEHELKIAKERAEEASRAKSEFLALMSHELKTPLTAIKGYSALLKDKTLEKLIETNKLAGVAGEIEVNSNHLEKMVNDLLEFSQLENGSLKYEKEIFTLDEILSYIRSISSTHQKASGCQYQEVIPDTSFKINANRQVLQQIITNLLINSFKFCNQTSVSLEIKKADGNLLVVVADKGIGIARDQQAKIFEAFYQVSLGTRRKYGGIGLGLSIVKKLVTWLNGSISLESAPDQGSRFEVTLPVIAD